MTGDTDVLQASVPDAERGTVVVYADIVCPWATVVLERMRRSASSAGLDVMIDVRPFALELVNRSPTSFEATQASLRAIQDLDPDLDLTPWPDRDGFPVTSLLSLEAVRATYAQSIGAAGDLDRELRRAMFTDHRCISLHHEILACAERCPDVDVDELDRDLRRGRSRPDVFEHLEQAESCDVQGSPHVLLSDGTAHFLPSLEIETDDDGGVVVVKDDPGEIDAILHQAAESMPRD